MENFKRLDKTQKSAVVVTTIAAISTTICMFIKPDAWQFAMAAITYVCAGITYAINDLF